MPSNYTKRITVSTNDPEHATEYLTCKGTVKEAVRMNPKNLSFGRIPRKADPQTKKITLTRGDGGPLALKLLGKTPNNIEAKLHEIEPAQHYELEVTVNPPFASDRLSATLKLDTGVPEAPTASVRVFASVTPRVSPQPRNIKIPETREPDWKQTISLIWDDNKSPKISKATIDNPGLSVGVDERENQQVIVLEVLPDYVPRARRQFITLFTDDPETPQIKVPLTVSTKAKARRGARPMPPSRDTQETKVKKPEPEATGTETTKKKTTNPPPEPVPE